MWFGLFGGRMTTDDTVEQIEMNAELINVRNSAELQLRQRQASRFTDQWEENDELQAEVNTLRARVQLLELERVNLTRLAFDMAIDRRAIFNQLPRLPEDSTKLETPYEEKRRAERDRLRSVARFVDSVSKHIERCSNSYTPRWPSIS